MNPPNLAADLFAVFTESNRLAAEFQPAPRQPASPLAIIRQRIAETERELRELEAIAVQAQAAIDAADDEAEMMNRERWQEIREAAEHERARALAAARNREAGTLMDARF